MKAPCFNCPDRTLDCHTTCQIYVDYKRSLLEIHKANEGQYIAADFIIVNCKKKKLARLKKKRY